jgi:DNA repair protein RecO (recombination protein O)
VRQIITKGIVLGRTDYGEADRIITMLTPDQGKLRVMARGVRRSKSKLAGGIELFSISDVTYMPGKGEIGTLISTRLDKYYANIVKDIDRVQTGYELIKQLNKATEDEPEEEYFHLLNESFKALDDDKIDLELIKIWFQAQLLKFSGHTPNLVTDTEGRKLEAGKKYNFDFENMSFIDHPQGRFTAGHIKSLRLLFSENPPKTLSQIQGMPSLLASCGQIIQTMIQSG